MANCSILGESTAQKGAARDSASRICNWNVGTSGKSGRHLEKLRISAAFYSRFCGRSMMFRMASRGDLPLVQDGVHLLGDRQFDAMLARPVPSRAPAVPTPSATMCMPASISSSERPLPSSMPTCRLRLSAPVQVSTRSPRPASPLNVSGRAPSATARRVISARPRVISAAKRVGTEAQPLAGARRDGDHIFHRAGEFDAEHVVVGVQAKIRRGEFLLKFSGEGDVT